MTSENIIPARLLLALPASVAALSPPIAVFHVFLMFSHVAADVHPMQASPHYSYFGLALLLVFVRLLCSLKGFKLTPAAALALSNQFISFCNLQSGVWSQL